jgi:hypothetical protein
VTDSSDVAWAAQVGPMLTEPDVAELLGRPVAEVAGDPGLLRLTNPDGRRVYPVFQFDGRRPLTGLGDVLALLDGPLLPLTIASWLTGPKTDLDGRTAVQALRDGDEILVLRLAQQTDDAAGQ